MGCNLPIEIQKESMINNYHKWFSEVMMRHLEVASFKSHAMIRGLIELDDFSPVDEYNNFSSSATQTIEVFMEVIINLI